MELPPVDEGMGTVFYCMMTLCSALVCVYFYVTSQAKNQQQPFYKEVQSKSEGGLFDSWHNDKNIGNRQRSHGLLNLGDDEEIRF